MDVVNYLLMQGVHINVFDKGGLSPLHIAAKTGDVNMIELLIRHGSKVDSFLKDPLHTPLVSSIVSGRCESVTALLKAGAKVDGVLEDATPLYQAIRGDQNYLQMVEILLSFEANEHIPDELGCFPLHNAASFGKQDLVEFFLKRDHDPNKLSTTLDDIGQRETALHSAVLGGKPSIVRLLVNSGRVSVNCLSYPGLQTPIYSSVLNRNLEVTELLIELGADVNVKDAARVSPLHHATVSQDNEIMKVLIQNGASLEAKSHDGLTPLLLATIQGTLDSVILLAHFGASVNVTSIYGETALHFAVELNHLEKAMFLLNNGTDVNAVDCNGASPLHLAAVKGHDDIVELLCEQNETKRDIKDNFGATPLHLAVFNGHEKVALVLLKAGANHKITINGETAYDISSRRRFDDVAKLLGEFQIPKTADNKEDPNEGITTENKPDLESFPSYLQSVLATDGVGILPSDAEDITLTVTQFIKDLLEAVGGMDPRFASHATLSGSNAEGCKVGNPDEFDFMFFLPKLAEQFEFFRSDSDPAGYYQVTLNKERGVHGTKVDDLLRDDKYLLPQRIKACVFSHIEDVFLMKKIKVPQQIRFYLEDFNLESGKYRIVSENKPGCTLYLEWRDGLYTGMLITIDLIPTLPFVCSKKDLVQLTPQGQKLLIETSEEHSDTIEKTRSLYLIPKPTKESSERILWRVSTSQIETQILQRLPDCKKSCFILGKILLEQTGKIPQGIEEYGSIEYYIHTYLLKTAFLHEVARVPENSSWLEDNFIQRLKEIFQLLKKSFKAGSLFSFFIENYDVLREDDILAENAARVWIADAIFLFLSDEKYFMQEDLSPRKLKSILRSLRPETCSEHLSSDITMPHKKGFHSAS